MDRNNLWNWWAGRTGEWMTVGPCHTRDDAVAGGLRDIGEGYGDFVVMEARSLIPPSLDADTVINDYFEHLGDTSDYYSGEGDYPEWLLPDDQQKVAEAELQQLLTAWSEKWLINHMNDPDQFGETRNQETISNTVDPDMLPGGHDNPMDPA